MIRVMHWMLQSIYFTPFDRLLISLFLSFCYILNTFKRLQMTWCICIQNFQFCHAFSALANYFTSLKSCVFCETSLLSTCTGYAYFFTLTYIIRQLLLYQMTTQPIKAISYVWMHVWMLTITILNDVWCVHYYVVQ